MTKIEMAKQFSPDIIRENAIKKAESAVDYALKDVSSARKVIEQWARRGVSEVDGLTTAELGNRANRAVFELARAQSILAELTGGITQ